MSTLKIISIKESQALNLTVDYLKKGGVIILPTDTVYGLSGLISNRQTIKKILSIKKRQFRKPLPLLVASISMAKKYAFINRQQMSFLKNCWPGAVTAVLNSKTKMPPPLTLKGKIGLRIPNYPWLIKLIKKLDQPLIGTSANLSGQPPISKIKEIIKFCRQAAVKPNLIISAGNLTKRRPSTVIDLTVEPPLILR